MDRSEKIGLGVAVAGHVVLFGLLSLGFLATPDPVKPVQPSIDVSLVKEVALEAAAPQAVTPPAQSVAPDTGEPEDAAPPAPAEPEPEPVPAPAPPPPEPAPAPKPQPKPAPKPAPAPKPVPKPQPRPKPPEPAAEKPASKPAPKPAKPVKAAATAPARPTKSAAPTATAAKTPPAKAKGTGATASATTTRPRGSRLGPNFLEGLSDQPTESKSQTPRAARIDGRALASIVQAIARQIQPCADRQVDPGPGANEIVTTLNLRLNENGTLTATPTVVRQSGITDENQRYARRVVDLGVAAFKGCSPLKLPPEFYSTPNGGWNNINYQWKLR